MNRYKLKKYTFSFLKAALLLLLAFIILFPFWQLYYDPERIIFWSSISLPVATGSRESSCGRALYFGRRISRLSNSNDSLLSGVRTGSRDGSDIVFKKTYRSSRCLCRGT